MAWQPPIVAVHGLKRGAREQAALLASQAAARGQVVIAPHFDTLTWKRYQQLVIAGRADLALIGLLAEVRAECPPLAHDMVLAGFSGGAQFAHRFAMLHPDRVRRLVITAAGWYTFPNDEPFPYGLGGGEKAGQAWGAAFAANLDRFLRLPMEVLVGAQDNAPDATLRRGARTDRVQGIGRLTRGRRWVHAVTQLAHTRGIRPNVSFDVLEGCTHDFAKCVAVGGLDRRIVGPVLEEMGR
ncbi:MAG: alpha/beta hydrolase [Pseudomonadota bacterium]